MTSFAKKIELCKLTISIAMPVIVGLSAYFIQQRMSEFQSQQSVAKEISVRLADRRLALYDQIKIPLNQTYCYIEQVGEWEKASVTELRQIRRQLNQIMYSNRAVWSPETFQLYINYIDDIAFETGEGVGPAKIRAEINQPRLTSEGWHAEAGSLLTGSVHPEHKEHYRRLNESLAADLMLPNIFY